MTNYSKVVISLVILSIAIISSLFLFLGPLQTIDTTENYYSSRKDTLSVEFPFATITQVRSPYSFFAKDQYPINKYRTSLYHYSLEYPARMKILSQGDGRGITVSERDNGPAIISIDVYETTLHTPDEWLTSVNDIDRQEYAIGKSLTMQYTTIDRRLLVSGYPAIITYSGDKIENFKSLQTAIIIKDGKLYQISIQTPQLNWVWDSFKFE